MNEKNDQDIILGIRRFTDRVEEQESNKTEQFFHSKSQGKKIFEEKVRIAECYRKIKIRAVKNPFDIAIKITGKFQHGQKPYCVTKKIS